VAVCARKVGVTSSAGPLPRSRAIAIASAITWPRHSLSSLGPAGMRSVAIRTNRFRFVQRHP
jgi:hypothetical protein